MFDHGLLSHTPIKNLDCPILKNLNDGFHFFMGWYDDSVLRTSTSPAVKQKNFSLADLGSYQTYSVWFDRFCTFILPEASEYQSLYCTCKAEWQRC